MSKEIEQAVHDLQSVFTQAKGDPKDTPAFHRLIHHARIIMKESYLHLAELKAAEKEDIIQQEVKSELAIRGCEHEWRFQRTVRFGKLTALVFKCTKCGKEKVDAGVKHE